MRKPVIAGNWKMHMTGPEAGRLALELKKQLASVEGIEIIVAPPFTALDEVYRQVKGSTIGMAGQNLHWKATGAFTGEISGPMLKAANCQYVIIGHSERRQMFGDTDAVINLKVKAALENDLTPIFCIGETLQERQAGKTWEILTRQVVQGLNGIEQSVVPRIIVAYEPVWAIGTGVTATTAQAQEAHGFLRNLLTESYPRFIAQSCRLLYGGSVKPDNVDGLMAQPDVDGVLVGGASLDAASFSRIVRYEPVA